MVYGLAHPYCECYLDTDCFKDSIKSHRLAETVAVGEKLKNRIIAYPNPPPPVAITQPGIWGCQWHSLTASM